MDTALCSKDTTDDTTRSFRLEGSERAMRAAASSRSKLAPMGVSSYGGLDDGALHRPRPEEKRDAAVLQLLQNRKAVAGEVDSDSDSDFDSEFGSDDF